MFQCDTAKECAIKSCHHRFGHDCSTADGYHYCGYMDCRVRCNPVPIRAHDKPCPQCGASRDYQATMGRTCAEDFHTEEHGDVPEWLLEHRKAMERAAPMVEVHPLLPWSKTSRIISSTLASRVSVALLSSMRWLQLSPLSQA